MGGSGTAKTSSAVGGPGDSNGNGVLTWRFIIHPLPGNFSQFAIANCPINRGFSMIYPLKMVLFYSYVRLARGHLAFSDGPLVLQWLLYRP